MVWQFTKTALSGTRILVLGLVIASAVFVSLGRIMLNATAYYDKELASLISDAVGLPVSIGTVTGGWEYFDAHMEVRRLTIGPGGNPAIYIERLALRLSTWHSLLEWSPVVAEIEVSGLKLTVEEHEPSRWRVKGMNAGNNAFPLRSLLTSLSQLESLHFVSLAVLVDTLNEDYQVTSDAAIPMRIMGHDQKLTLDMPLNIQSQRSGERSTVHLLGRIDGDIRHPEELSTDLFFRVPHLQLFDFLPRPEFGGLTLAHADLAADLWVHSEEGTLDAAAMIRSNQVSFKRDERVIQAAGQLEALVRLVGSTQSGEYFMTMPYLESQLAGETIRIEDINFAAQGTQSGWRVAVSAGTLDVASVVATIQRLDDRTSLFPENIRNNIDGTNARGQLQDVGALFDTATSRFRLTANVREVFLDPQGGIPLVTHLNGVVSANNSGGYLDIDSDNFEIQFAEVFASPWSLAKGSGRLRFTLGDRGFHFSSGLVEVERDNLSAVGALQINLFPNKRLNNWGLLVTVKEGDLKDTPAFLPLGLDEGLRDWVAGAVKSGQLEQGRLLLHGSLNKEANPIEKVHDMRFSVADGVLEYDPLWPELTGLRATLRANTAGVFTEDATGRVFDSVVSGGAVKVLTPIGGQATEAVVDATVRGKIADGIRLLNETPLSEVTASVAENWYGTGDITTKGHIIVPFGEVGATPLVDAEVALQDNTLTMPDYDLEAQALTGRLTYSEEKGLAAENYTATVFGEPVSGSIETIKQQGDDSGEILLAADGRVTAADLHQWADQPLLGQVAGMVPYKATVHVPFGGKDDVTFVEVFSSLVGTEVHMPPPMHKPEADAERQFFYRQEFLDDGHLISFVMENELGGSIRVVDGLVSGGRVNFGDTKLGATAYDRLLVRGSLPRVDYETWTNFFAEMQSAADVSLENEVARQLEDIRVQAAQLTIYGEVFADTDLVITREDGRWQLNAAAQTLKGGVTLFDDDDLPLLIDLDYVHLESGETEALEDPLADIAPQDFASIDFSTDELLVGEEDYGAWEFKFRPDANGASFQDITASVRGMEIIAPAAARWDRRDGEHVSGFTGLVQVADLGGTLASWGYASSIEGSEFEFLSEINWQGSPVMIDLERIRGNVRIGQGKGRFVQADSGTLKLLGIFDFAKLGRRFRLDFSDVVQKGYSFSNVTGAVDFNEGFIEVSDPILIKGTGSDFKVAGTVDLHTRALDNDMIVTLGVGKGIPWYAAYSAIATGPLVGAGVLLAQKIFENQINTISSAKYQISGTIEAPEIEFISIFRDDVRKKGEDTAGD